MAWVVISYWKHEKLQQAVNQHEKTSCGDWERHWASHIHRQWSGSESWRIVAFKSRAFCCMWRYLELSARGLRVNKRDFTAAVKSQDVIRFTKAEWQTANRSLRPQRFCLIWELYSPGGTHVVRSTNKQKCVGANGGFYLTKWVTVRDSVQLIQWTINAHAVSGNKNYTSRPQVGYTTHSAKHTIKNENVNKSTLK